MKRSTEITTLFLDVGGVLLTNGWGHQSRALAAKAFGLNLDEMEDRHHLTFDTYEVGKLTLEEYLIRTVFYEERPFTQGQFREFMFAQSQPHPEMIDLIRNLKAQHELRIAVVNNEARELNSHRIQRFRLAEFVDFFISSCYVHIRKPDADIFRLALDIAQGRPSRSSISRTSRCSSRSRKVLGFAASVTRIAGPLANNWPRSACGTTVEP